jgi:hypothetical protein
MEQEKKELGSVWRKVLVLEGQGGLKCLEDLLCTKAGKVNLPFDLGADRCSCITTIAIKA